MSRLSENESALLEKFRQSDRPLGFNVTRLDRPTSRALFRLLRAGRIRGVFACGVHHYFTLHKNALTPSKSEVQDASVLPLSDKQQSGNQEE